MLLIQILAPMGSWDLPFAEGQRWEKKAELPEEQQGFASETTAHGAQLQLTNANLTYISSPSICLPPEASRASILAGCPSNLAQIWGCSQLQGWGGIYRCFNP